MVNDNNLDIVVSLKDQATKGLNEIDKQQKEFAISTELMNKKMSSSFADIAKQQQQVTAEIEALEKESAKLFKTQKELETETKKFANALADVEKKAQSSKLSLGNLTKSFIAGGLALGGIQMGLQLVRDLLTNGVQDNLNYQNSLNGLISQVRAFGLSEDGVKQSVTSLTQDGLLTQADAMKGLQNLIAGGLGVEQATQLMNSYKDVAAFGRDTTISFSQAVLNNSEAFLTEMSVLGNRAGLQENFNQIIKLGAKEMGKNVNELNASERAMAKYYGTLVIAQRAQGNSSKMAQTFQGDLIKQQAILESLSITVGSSFTPVLQQLIRTFDLGSGAGQVLTFVIKTIGTIATAVAGGIRILTTSIGHMANTVSAWAKQIKNAVTGAGFSMQAIQEQMSSNVQEMGEVFLDVGSSIDEIWTGMGDQIGSVAAANTDYMNEMSDSTAKALEDIQKELERHQKALDDMVKQYEDSLRDMVIAHRDKTDELKKDLEEEDKAYQENLDEILKDNKKAMTELEDRHGEKTDKILADIEKEKKETQKEIDEINEDYAILLSDMEKNGSNRIASLKAQLDKELDRQSTANKERVTMLKKMIKEEEKANQQNLETLQQLKEDEIRDEEDKQNEKLSSLQSDLDKENSEYRKSVEEKKASYDEDVANLKKSHEKRRSEIVSNLNIELALQTKYSEDFAKYKDAVAEDDISRLKRKLAEERKAEEEAHQQKLADLQRRTSEVRQVSSSGTTTGISQTKVAVPTEKITSFDVAKSILSPGLSFAGETSKPASSSSGGGVISAIGSAISSATNWVKGLFGFADGGSFTVGGKPGIDQNVVAFKASKGEQVTVTNPVRGGGQGLNINMPVTVVNSDYDIDRMAERLAWAIDKSGITTR